jgi:two-component system, NarL family, nitrate/nitrite response regulator NarL
MLGGLLLDLIDRNREADWVLVRYIRLTPREREVLELLGEGCDHDTVASILGISPQTARTHIQNVITKIEVHSSVQAASLAVRFGLAERLRTARR